MQIICVSRGSLERGRELAESLAEKLGYPVLSRETLIEEATRAGIQVGKLEMTMVKPQRFTERLARERDHYLAFSTAYLCDRALEGPLVYHGRTGHLLLRGINHVLRIRVVADEEDRLAVARRQLGLDHEKARRYLEAVEEDRRSWARAMYGRSGEETSDYDLVVNVQRMGVHNAAASLIGTCQLPEFRMTPASRRALEDLRLAARARVLLARDPRTRSFSFAATAHTGALAVTYLPHDAEAAPHIEPVLEPLEGVTELAVTMASTTILWLQEAFDPASQAFRDVVEIARNWNAAVELVKCLPAEEASPVPALAGAVAAPAVAGAISAPQGAMAGRTGAPAMDPAAGGIEEDVEEEPVDPDLMATLNELARLGRSGGARYVYGDRRSLVTSCCSGIPHSLVVVGDLFRDKDPSARTRLRREVQESIASRMRVPVVTAEELRAEYLFGRPDLMRLVGYAAVVVVLYLLVFTNQLALLEFLSAQGGVLDRLLVAAAVFAFIPIVAWSYGTVARTVMKLIRME